jgi:UDP-glucose 4-epimerase
VDKQAILITAAECNEARQLVTFLEWKYPGHLIVQTDHHPVQPNTIPLDVRETAALKQLLLDKHITMIMHLDALRAVDEFLSWEMHTQSLLNLLETASACGVAKVCWALPACSKGTIPEIIGISGNL